MADIDKQTEEKIQQLQMIENSINNLLAQRQQFHSTLVEIDSAITELETTTKVYKIVGNIMVSGEKDKIKTDLESKKEIIELRIKNLEKQENQIKEKAKKIQAEVLDKMKAGENDE